jgi:hypothetical protein
MNKSLDYLIIKICEKLPFDNTIYEHNGFCKKETNECSYSRKTGDDKYFCYKKTYNLKYNLIYNK